MVQLPVGEEIAPVNCLVELATPGSLRDSCHRIHQQCLFLLVTTTLVRFEKMVTRIVGAQDTSGNLAAEGL
jgi:hypothetical protein